MDVRQAVRLKVRRFSAINLKRRILNPQKQSNQSKSVELWISYVSLFKEDNIASPAVKQTLVKQTLVGHTLSWYLFQEEK